MGAVSGEEYEDEDVALAGTEVGRLERIFVSVRLRPLNAKEIAAHDSSDWECINDTTVIFRNSLGERSNAPTSYTFDRVFRGETSTRQVYEEAAKEVALSVVSGINSTIFAYGQTSSGKTYTMSGITEYTVGDIYDYIKMHEEREFVLKFSAIEIYNEAVRDLLSMDNSPLRLLDDPERGTVVEKLTEVLLRDWNHLKELIAVCEAQRQIGETLLNEMSSRSHQILRLIIESTTREFLGNGGSSTLTACVNFVDLAGSERASQALSVGSRLKEGCHINRSLLSLGTVIRKLSKGRSGHQHIPYRDSKLTRILQPSLGGNARTAIICTICPARSHIEQSRNTLLFASCAKEVVTSARVNVVMSDKALVKHLQKELSRLEEELKYPKSSTTISHYEKSLKEKDMQIKKMEKEIKELILQRDLAQTRLEDFLRTVGNDHPFIKHKKADEDAYPKFLSYERGNKKEDYMHSDEEGEEDISQGSDEDSEDQCKVVRCIEINNKPVIDEDTSTLLDQHGDSLPLVALNSSIHDEHEERNSNPSYLTLEQHLQNVRDRLNNFVKPYADSGLSSSRDLVLSRSRSCRESAINASPWFYNEENCGTTPVSSHKTYHGRTERFQKRCIALNYENEMETLSRDDSLNFERGSAFEGESVTSGSKVGITDIQDFVSGLKMARVQFQAHAIDPDNETSAQETTMGSGLDLVAGLHESPSQWPIEFEKKQREIIDLWHRCNVALVHRTYFFILFKGDPSDSIYMEVELRRLSFLKRAFSQGITDMRASIGGQAVTMASSIRRLKREREMLFKQMPKKFSAKERESLYTKWGIALDSKQRKWQLIQNLWTKTEDLEHIRESASIVAKLIGLSEPGFVLKEMFGLSFAPEQYNGIGRRSFNWKHGISSLK